jgi:shikimate kinase
MSESKMIEDAHIPVRERNIVLIGFMGVGKSTVGQILAKKLYRDFIDVDKEIEKMCHMPITEIFKQFGEQEFRKMEREYIVQACAHTRSKILSLGGGAFLQEEVRKACLTHCIVCFLDLSWESWKERLPFLIDSRPVLQNKSLDEMEELFRKRRDAYAYHHFKIPTNDLDPETIADHIVQSLHDYWDII